MMISKTSFKGLLLPFFSFFFLNTASTQADSLALQKMYDDAIESNKKNDYDHSKILLDSALVIAYNTIGKQNKLTSKLHGLLVHVLPYHNDYSGAQKNYEIASEIVNSIDGYPNGSNVILNSNMAQVYIAKGELDSAILLMKETLPIALKYLPDDHERHARVCIKTGLAFWRTNNMDSVEYYFAKAVGFFEGKDKQSYLYAGLCNNLGITYFNKGNYRKAKEYFEISYATFSATVAPDSREGTQPLMNIGNALTQMGKVEEGIEYYEQARRYLTAKNVINNSRYNLLIENLASAKGQLGKFEEAIALKLAIKGSYDIEENRYNTHYITFYHGLAENYLAIGKVDSALYYLGLADPEIEKLDEKPSYQSIAYLISSKCYFEKGNEIKANDLIDLAISETAKIKDVDPWFLVQCTLEKAHQSAKSNKVSSFNEYISKSYEYISFNQTAGKIDPAYNRLEELLKVQTQHIEGLHDLSTSNADQNYLEEILRQFDLFKQNINLQSESNVNSSSFYDLTNSSNKVFDIAMNASLSLHEKTGDEDYLVKAIEVANTNKSRRLLASMQAKSNMKFKDVPTSVMEQKFIIEDSILHYKNLMTEDSLSEVASLKNNLFALLRKRDQWNAQIEADYPAYSAVNGKSVYQLNRNIKASELIIDTYLTEETAAVFFLSDGQINVHIVEDPIVFYNTLKETISEIKSGKESNDLLAQVSRSIFGEYQIPESVININVVPSNLLLQLPFELLEYAEVALVEKYNLSYHANQSLIQRNNSGSKSVSSIASFAPKYQQETPDTVLLETNKIYAGLVRDGEYALPGAQQEVEKINDLIGGEVYVGEEATESTFLGQTLTKDIIHLAMHSIMNEENGMNSFLLFGDNQDSLNDQKLYAYEVYHLDMDSELLVLSACNTGTGELKNGEGSLSMAHAFQYAGAKSIVSSLWRVPDQSSSYLMTQFYGFLKDGMKKDQALRQAKLSYLNDETIPDSQKTPYYYAGFIATGDMASLEFASPNRLVWIGALLAGLLILLFVRSRQKKSSS